MLNIKCEIYKIFITLKAIKFYYYAEAAIIHFAPRDYGKDAVDHVTQLINHGNEELVCECEHDGDEII